MIHSQSPIITHYQSYSVLKIFKKYYLINGIICCNDNLMNEYDLHNHLFGYEAALQIPQVFPLASLTNPLSPQVVPQEFLTCQY